MAKTDLTDPTDRTAVLSLPPSQDNYDTNFKSLSRALDKGGVVFSLCPGRGFCLLSISSARDKSVPEGFPNTLQGRNLFSGITILAQSRKLLA